VLPAVESVCFNPIMSRQIPQAVALFTDFGPGSLYTGQLQAVLASAGIQQPVIELVSDAPIADPKAAAYLLAAVADAMPLGTLFLAVVDPGVGSDRWPLIIQTRQHWFVGPDNGLFSQVVSQPSEIQLQTITWQPPRLSDSFHGRDLFAPVAAMLCRGEMVAGGKIASNTLVGHDWPRDLFQVVYIDYYGNAFTGIRGDVLPKDAEITVAEVVLGYARVFSQVPVGALFWYVNANGLVEIAANQGRAADLLGLAVGTPVAVI
jgi:hypothetical protein